MTKKKVIKLVVLGILLLFLLSSVLNYGVANEMLVSDFRETANNLYIPSNFQLNFESVKDYKTKCAESAGYSIGELFLYELNYRYSTSRYPCSLAMADKNGNLIFAPKNYFVAYADEGHYLYDVYISIDEYITDEFISDFNEFKSLADNKSVNVSEIRVYKNGNDYIPVSATFGIPFTDYTKTFVFSDYPVTDTFSKCAQYYRFNEIESASYNKKYYDLLEQEIKENYEEDKKTGNGWNGGGAYISSNESTGDNTIFIEGEEFKIYYAMKYNQFLYVLFSEDFIYLTICLAIMYIIAGSIFLPICLKLLKKSEKLDIARKTFISAASHELKTPIAVIQNQCECVMENVAPEKNQEYIMSIYDEALRMNSIVASLLSYNRLSQLKDVKKEKCNLSQLLKDETEKYRGFAEGSGAIIIEDIADGIYTRCNAEMMKLAIDNLLSNAVKYSVGDKKIKVSLTADKKGFVLLISNPADEKSKDIKKNWDILSRGDASRERDGASTGMGLPICRRILELHNFKADCRYESGRVQINIRPSGR